MCVFRFCSGKLKMRHSVCPLVQTQAAAAAPAIDGCWLDEKDELIGPRSVGATPGV